jgi:nickel-type superoxide dismutase maturation protease
MLKLWKVAGQSLQPNLQPGDFVLVAKIPWLFGAIRQGDVVVFRHAGYGTLIKRVERVEDSGGSFYVLGTDEDSVDSRRFGPVPEAAVIGKVIWKISRL